MLWSSTTTTPASAACVFIKAYSTMSVAEFAASLCLILPFLLHYASPIIPFLSFPSFLPFLFIKIPCSCSVRFFSDSLYVLLGSAPLRSADAHPRSCSLGRQSFFWCSQYSCGFERGRLHAAPEGCRRRLLLSRAVPLRGGACVRLGLTPRPRPCLLFPTSTHLHLRPTSSASTLPQNLPESVPSSVFTAVFLACARAEPESVPRARHVSPSDSSRPASSPSPSPSAAFDLRPRARARQSLVSWRSVHVPACHRTRAHAILRSAVTSPVLISSNPGPPSQATTPGPRPSLSSIPVPSRVRAAYRYPFVPSQLPLAAAVSDASPSRRLAVSCQARRFPVPIVYPCTDRPSPVHLLSECSRPADCSVLFLFIPSCLSASPPPLQIAYRYIHPYILKRHTCTHTHIHTYLLIVQYAPVFC